MNGRRRRRTSSSRFKLSSEESARKMAKLSDEDDLTNCVVCKTELSDPVCFLSCLHIICRQCYLIIGQESRCPLCRAEITEAKSHPVVKELVEQLSQTRKALVDSRAECGKLRDAIDTMLKIKMPAKEEVKEETNHKIECKIKAKFGTCAVEQTNNSINLESGLTKEKISQVEKNCKKNKETIIETEKEIARTML